MKIPRKANKYPPLRPSERAKKLAAQKALLAKLRKKAEGSPKR